MRKTIFFLPLIIAAMFASAQSKPQYAISLIPDSLKTGVNSVIREQTTSIIIKKPGKAVSSIRKVVSVLNEKAESELVFYEFFDRFRKIDDIEINIYDATGKYMKKSRKRDLHTESAGDGGSLIEDSKVIYAQLRTGYYPLTIEINYDIIYEGFLELLDFYPQTAEQSIQLKTYSITSDANNSIRYKNYRCDLKPTKTANGAMITNLWQVKNVKPFEKEPGSAEDDVPRIRVSPTLFEMDDYPGDMTSWDSYGRWIVTLNNKINILPEDSKKFYRELVKNASSEREKVAILYQHLQDNYRYVSIQLGIGGHRPFPASFTEKKKYGDCKGLSNLMYAMLDAVNIRSHYTVINAGRKRTAADPSFPEDMFNHIILCVPQAKDTIWLECTSRTQPFATLGTFTENRHGVLVTEKGGVLAATPKSKAAANVMHSTSFVKMGEDGSGVVTVDIDHSGEFSDISDFMLNGEEQNKKNYLINHVGFKQPDYLQISKKAKQESKAYTLHYDMEFEKVPEFSAGSKHFMNPRMYKFWSDALPKSEKRQSDYYLDFPLIQSDSTIYELPDGFIADNLPKAATLTSSLAKYESSYSFDAQKKQLITYCKLQIDYHIISPAKYDEMARFFSDVIKEQQQKIVVKKN
ncbi:MAG: DUF3857 domain-containing protein [Chitinophagaceae bacterium]|nr:DUF3857 domain-containing protein [Chitinophagaceae bacterium]